MISIEDLCGKKDLCRSCVLDAVIHLAVAIAREGREGRKITGPRREQKVADLHIVTADG